MTYRRDPAQTRIDRSHSRHQVWTDRPHPMIHENTPVAPRLLIYNEEYPHRRADAATTAVWTTKDDRPAAEVLPDLGNGAGWFDVDQLNVAD